MGRIQNDGRFVNVSEQELQTLNKGGYMKKKNKIDKPKRVYNNPNMRTAG